MNAILALEDGTWFQGVSAGAPGQTEGEVVFNTSMSGYQEVLTDPNFMTTLALTDRQDPLRYEKALIGDWFRKEFGRK